VSAESGLIAFEQDKGASSDIFTMTPSGGSLRQLTTWRGADFSPSRSPDGRHREKQQSSEEQP
jgi:Tol biopolymer transport system component